MRTPPSSSLATSRSKFKLILIITSLILFSISAIVWYQTFSHASNTFLSSSSDLRRKGKMMKKSTSTNNNNNNNENESNEFNKDGDKIIKSDLDEGLLLGSAGAFSLEGENNIHNNQNLNSKKRRTKKSQKDAAADTKTTTTSRINLPPRLVTSLRRLVPSESNSISSEILGSKDDLILKSETSSDFLLQMTKKQQQKPDIEVFVIWYDALHKTDKILTHMRKHFVIISIEFFDWVSSSSSKNNHDHNNKNNNNKMSKHDFQTNLWRLYSGKGGWERIGMDKKVKQCGFGSFIAIVVLDPKPVYKDEITAHGIDRVNHNMNDAKKLYRQWSGGGFRVHGTFGAQEASHDIPILFHRDEMDFVKVLESRIKKETEKENKNDNNLLVVDKFVRKLLLLSASPHHHNNKEEEIIIEEILSYENSLNPRREISFFNNNNIKDDEKSCEYKLETGFHNSIQNRDSSYSSQFITNRQTLGNSGWYSCRDFLLALKSFPCKVQELVVSSSTKQEKKSTTKFPNIECIPCDEWPSKLEIVVTDEKEDEHKQPIRWSISSLLATSSEKVIFTSRKKHKNKENFYDDNKPREFDVPFFISSSSENNDGKGGKLKTVVKRIRVSSVKVKD